MTNFLPTPTAESLLDRKTSLAGLVVASQDIRFTSAEVATATTLTANHYFVKVTGGATITLPKAVEHKERAYTVMNVGRSSVSLNAYTGEKINGVSSIKLDSKYSFATVISDADEWLIIGGIDVSSEAILNDIKTLLDSHLRKLLFIQAKAYKHIEDSSTKVVDDAEVQEELQELEVETELIEA